MAFFCWLNICCGLLVTICSFKEWNERFEIGKFRSLMNPSKHGEKKEKKADTFIYLLFLKFAFFPFFWSKKTSFVTTGFSFSSLNDQSIYPLINLDHVKVWTISFIFCTTFVDLSSPIGSDRPDSYRLV